MIRCQNFAMEGPEADPAFDDGGFFFTPTDPVRNKAGAAGTDRRGQVRYHSYGSATADGSFGVSTPFRSSNFQTKI